MIAHNPLNPADKWLVSSQFMADNYELAVPAEKGPTAAAAAPGLADMPFGTAMACMQRGLLVARQGWNGKGMFIFLVPGSVFEVNRPPLLGIFAEGVKVEYQPHIDMFTADGTVVPWLCSQSDMQANDWMVVERQ
jgi:hypothetical protein